MPAHVRFHNGTPTLFLDGRPVFAGLIWDSGPRADGYPGAAVARRYAEAGIHLHTFDVGSQNTNEWCGPHEGGDGHFDFSQTETRFRRVLDADPEARFHLRVHLDMRSAWWLNLYPDECEVTSDGRRFFASFASIVWREQARDFLRTYIAHFESIGLADRVIAYQTGAGGTGEWVKGEGSMASRCADYYLLQDLLEDRLPPCRLYIFLNPFRLDRDRREALARTLRRSGRTALWIYAPGYIEDEPALEHMTALTGFRFGRGEHPWGPLMHVTAFDHPITEKLPQDLVWGTNSVLGPVFHLEDPEARVLGQVVYAQGECRPGMGVKTFDGWTSVYVAAPNIPAPVLRGVARYAGVHLYSEDGDALISRDEGSGERNKWVFWYGAGRTEFHLNSPTMAGVFLGSAPWTPNLLLFSRSSTADGAWTQAAAAASATSNTVTFPGISDFSQFIIGTTGDSPLVGTLIRGDVNLDNTVNILDVIVVVRIILGALPAPSPETPEFFVADANEDGAIDVLDVVHTVNIILRIF